MYYPEKARAFLFHAMRRGGAANTIVVGRGKDADIRIDRDLAVSEAHAELEIGPDNTVWLREHKARNGIYIDDERISGPVRLTVGMEIWLGRTRLIATDEHGCFPIAAVTISEMCRRSVDLYGNCVAAGERLGRSKDFIRRQLVSRSQRYKKYKPNKPRK